LIETPEGADDARQARALGTAVVGDLAAAASLIGRAAP
jgi:hypothetical protein